MIPVTSQLRLITSNHLHDIASHRSAIREIDAKHAADDVDLLAQIGYKQELRRSYSTLQVFGIAFSIMGLLPSIATTLASGLEAGPVGLVWGWFIAGFFILSTGISMSFLGSSIPTSGGLFYYTNHYCNDLIRVPLSFLIGIANTLALTGGLCSITYGFSGQVLAAVYMSNEGTFVITDAKLYGVFAGAIVIMVVVCCATTRHTALMQSVSIYVNTFLIVLFFIAVPIGASRTHGFNDAAYIFGDFENFRTWLPGWSFMLSWMPAIWTIGAYDSCLHMSEECKDPQKKVPIGIIGSITVCWLVGWCICIASVAMIKDKDLERVLGTDTGSAMAQIVYDALGRNWAIAIISLISFAQWLMGLSLLIAISRQIYAFARDNGLPFIYNYIKVVDPRIKVPVRASVFGGILGLVMGLLILVGTTAANALFSLGVASNLFAFGMPVLLVLLPTGRSRFVPGPFYFGKTILNIINWVTVSWVVYLIIMVMFPDNKEVNKETMNYTCAINFGVWILALIYFFVHGYKHYHGPVSNLDQPGGSDSEGVHYIAEVMGEKA